jgi:aminoglycoside phosphotransferase (APT) family kinase protein
VVSEDGERLLLVVDFEEVAVADPHYDFRYLVSIRRDLDWFTACCDAYERSSGRRLSIERILAWHIRTALGDALWRTELGVTLPGDLTPDDYIDDITRRLAELGLDISIG